MRKGAILGRVTLTTDTYFNSYRAFHYDSRRQAGDLQQELMNLLPLDHPLKKRWSLVAG